MINIVCNNLHFLDKLSYNRLVKVKVKVSHSLMAIGAVGVRVPTVTWAQLMKGGAHPSPFAALSFPNSKKVPIFCWVDRVFQSPHGAAEPRTHAIRRLSAP